MTAVLGASTQACEHLDAIHSRHDDVGEDDVGRRAPQAGETPSPLATAST
jgi:hypothetical protein